HRRRGSEAILPILNDGARQGWPFPTDRTEWSQLSLRRPREPSGGDKPIEPRHVARFRQHDGPELRNRLPAVGDHDRLTAADFSQIAPEAGFQLTGADCFGHRLIAKAFMWSL